MQKMVSQGKRDDEVRKEIGKILNGAYDDLPKCANKDHLCYAQAVYTFARDHIKYAYDPHLVEYVESARRILRNKIADCDSIVILMAAMLENIGLATQFVTIKADPERPDEFSHVYLRVKIPNVGWVALDPTMPNKNFGWEAPGNHPTKYWPGSTDEAQMPVDQGPTVQPGMFGMRGYGVPAPYPLAMNAFHAPPMKQYPMIPIATSQNDHRGRYFSGLRADDAWRDEIGDFHTNGHETICVSVFNPHNPMAGMGSLGDVDSAKVSQAESSASSLQSSDPGMYDFIKGMWDGSVINAFTKTRRQLTLQQQALLSRPQPSNRDWVMARNDFKIAAQAFNNTVNKWNRIAQAINFGVDTFGIGDHLAQMSPLAVSGGLGDLGLPAALIPIGEFIAVNPWAAVAGAAIGAVIIIVGLAEISDLISSALTMFGLTAKSQSTLDKIGDLPGKWSDALSGSALTIGGVALAGVAAFVVVRMLKKKGTI